MGPSDRESWLLRSAYPTGRATGWRRAGCLVMLIVPLVVVMVVIVVMLATGSDSGTP